MVLVNLWVHFKAVHSCCCPIFCEAPLTTLLTFLRLILLNAYNWNANKSQLLNDCFSHSFFFSVYCNAAIVWQFSLLFIYLFIVNVTDGPVISNDSKIVQTLIRSDTWSKCNELSSLEELICVVIFFLIPQDLFRLFCSAGAPRWM